MKTIDSQQIAIFSKDSVNWWDETGPFKPLHRLNPSRLEYISGQIAAHFKDRKNLKILDIGCGGGLVCEPLTRQGHTLTGIDADKNAITTAKFHAAEMGLDIEYIAGDATELIKQKRRFDVVMGLEVVEHTSSPSEFVALTKALLKDDGLVIFSTLNRTWQSALFGIGVAEYILNWVPKGTHEWKRFLKPSEFARLARQNKLQVIDVCGLTYNPQKDSFSLSHKNLSINYFISAKPANDKVRFEG